jgi:hypothetical protein
MLYVGLTGGAESGGDGVGRWVGSSGDGERSSGGYCAHGWPARAAGDQDRRVCMTQGALKPPASSGTAGASSGTPKGRARRFSHCFHLPLTSVLAGRVVDLILESLHIINVGHDSQSVNKVIYAEAGLSTHPDVTHNSHIRRSAPYFNLDITSLHLRSYNRATVALCCSSPTVQAFSRLLKARGRHSQVHAPGSHSQHGAGQEASRRQTNVR